MKRLPYWADGALFGVFLVPVVFFLKMICPLQTGCFADPFLVPIFSPLIIVEAFARERVISFQGEIFFITIFWGVVFSLLANLWSKFSKDTEKSSNLTDETN
jgi:hypothetical protein